MAQKTCLELTEAHVNILLYVRSSLESYTPLLMHAHGRIFWNRNLVTAMELLQPCPHTCVALDCCPQLWGRTQRQLSSEGNCQNNWLNRIHSIRKDTGLKSGVPYPALPRISAISMYKHKTLKVWPHPCTCYLAPPNSCLRSRGCRTACNTPGALMSCFSIERTMLLCWN